MIQNITKKISLDEVSTSLLKSISINGSSYLNLFLLFTIFVFELFSSCFFEKQYALMIMLLCSIAIIYECLKYYNKKYLMNILLKLNRNESIYNSDIYRDKTDCNSDLKTIQVNKLQYYFWKNSTWIFTSIILLMLIYQCNYYYKNDIFRSIFLKDIDISKIDHFTKLFSEIDNGDGIYKVYKTLGEPDKINYIFGINPDFKDPQKRYPVQVVTKKDLVEYKIIDAENIFEGKTVFTPKYNLNNLKKINTNTNIKKVIDGLGEPIAKGLIYLNYDAIVNSVTFYIKDGSIINADIDNIDKSKILSK